MGQTLTEKILDPDLLAGFEFALDEVVVENLLRECLSHNVRTWDARRYKSRESPRHCRITPIVVARFDEHAGPGNRRRAASAPVCAPVPGS